MKTNFSGGSSKYSDFTMTFPIIFIEKDNRYFSGKNYLFSDFMNGKIKEIKNEIPSEKDLTMRVYSRF